MHHHARLPAALSATSHQPWIVQTLILQTSRIGPSPAYPPRMITLISVSRATLLRAQAEILGCEACSEWADRPFTWTLDRVSGQDPSVTDYILSEPAKCPRYQGPVFEETLVEDWG